MGSIGEKSPDMTLSGQVKKLEWEIDFQYILLQSYVMQWMYSWSGTLIAQGGD